jgi:hypothetical protein
VSAIGVDGAAVSTLGDPLGSETICASDDATARLDEIQLDLGEGPCWEALSTGLPVVESDLQHSVNPAWPLARELLRATGIGALYAFPLVVAGIKIGAVDLYSDTSMRLTDQQLTDASLLSGILARQVLRRGLVAANAGQEDADLVEGVFSRREVHQATGMVLAQMRLTADDALLVLQGHAFAEGRPLRDVAADVIARRLDFTDPTDPTD